MKVLALCRAANIKETPKAFSTYSYLRESQASSICGDNGRSVLTGTISTLSYTSAWSTETTHLAGVNHAVAT